MGINGTFCRPGESLASIVKGGFADAATLHLLHSGDRIKAPPGMATAVAKSMVGPVIPMDHYDAFGKTFLLFKAYGAVMAAKFGGAGKIHDDPFALKGPALFIRWLFGCTYSKETLDDISMKGCGLHDSKFLLCVFGVLIGEG
jgi:hypothetical protein